MDIVDRIKKRFPTHLEIFPVTVQGTKSANEIISGINFFNNISKVDVIIVARGGGGAEDFLPFNDEQVIRNVFSSNIPIISAIGHETDFTLIDFVADIRAATPTAAAEIAVPELKNLKQNLLQIFKSLKFAIETLLDRELKKIINIRRMLNYRSLLNLIRENENSLKSLSKNLIFVFKNINQTKNFEIKNLSNRLNNLDVKNILKRGFSIVREHKKKNIIKSNKIKENSLIDIELSNGIVTAKTISNK